MKGTFPIFQKGLRYTRMYKKRAFCFACIKSKLGNIPLHFYYSILTFQTTIFQQMENLLSINFQGTRVLHILVHSFPNMSFSR